MSADGKERRRVGVQGMRFARAAVPAAAVLAQLLTSCPLSRGTQWPPQGRDQSTHGRSLRERRTAGSRWARAHTASQPAAAASSKGARVRSQGQQASLAQHCTQAAKNSRVSGRRLQREWGEGPGHSLGSSTYRSSPNTKALLLTKLLLTAGRGGQETNEVLAGKKEAELHTQAGICRQG